MIWILGNNLMNKNSWHEKMYDDYFASINIDTPYLHKQAKKEVGFLIEAMGMKKGDRVLDLPCGTGRHSNYLAKKGLNVTGVDISTACLKRAREKFLNKNIQFKKGNMANLSQFESKFDYALNLFSSFGYFQTDKENENVLRQMVSTVKDGGQIAVNLINRDWLLKVYCPVDWRKDGDLFLSESRKYCSDTYYNESNLIVLNEKTGRAKRYYHRCRLYSKNEMVSLFKKVGLKKIKVHGDHLGSPFRKYESTHPIYIGEKSMKV